MTVDHADGKTPTRSGRVGYHHGDLRRDLLIAAHAEIALNGAASVSLASLARLAGVAQSAPYRHFADRRALLEAVAAEGFVALTRAMRDAVAQQRTAQSDSQALTQAYARFGEANIELYRLMFASRLTPEASDGSVLDVAAGEAFAFLRAVIVGGPAGRDEEADARIVFTTWASVHGLVMLKADGFIVSPLEGFL